MVYFTCNNCGASLKKNTVEKHYNGCRRPIALTCVDCLKDFFGQDYVGHTSCLTEDEKYSAKGFQSRPPSNKGEKKQQAWVEVVHSVCDVTTDLPERQSHLLKALRNQHNIPQKMVKFKNFVTSFSGRSYVPAVVDQVYELLASAYKAVKEKEHEKSDTNVIEKQVEEMEVEEEEKNENSDEKVLSNKEKKAKRKKEKYEAQLRDAEQRQPDDEEETTGVSAENGTKKKRKRKKGQDELPTQTEMGKTKKRLRELEENEMDTKVSQPKKSKKQKRIEQEEEEYEVKNTLTKAADETNKVNGSSVVKFDWSDTICKVLEAAQEKELSVKRLRKKVLAEYEAVVGDSHETEVTILAKFNKKLSKTRGVVLLKDKARLKQ